MYEPSWRTGGGFSTRLASLEGDRLRGEDLIGSLQAQLTNLMDEVVVVLRRAVSQGG